MLTQLRNRIVFPALICLAIVNTLCSQTASQNDSRILPQDAGRLGLENMLRKLHTTARLLQTTAHPDDEDGAMLSYESRAKGAEVMLLTLTRGDGGQNKTGSNFFDELGVLRTLELLESDKYYGVAQRFSRVADFGFSKSAEETFQKWGGKEVPLADMVRVIRTFRPDVVASRFSGTPRDGHGNHQAAGILTPEAVSAAADPKRFPDQIGEGLLPWQVKKLYMGVRGSEDYTVRIDAGQRFAPLGMSYAEFGIQGYSHQKSQNARVYQVPPGPNYREYRLADSTLSKPAPGAHEEDFFDGIDTSLPGLAELLGSEQTTLPSLRSDLQEIEKKVDESIAAEKVSPAKAALPLLAGRRLTAALIRRVEHANAPTVKEKYLLDRLETKRQQFQEAANLALGLSLVSDMNTPNGSNMVVPGERVSLSTHLQNTSGANVQPSPEVHWSGWKPQQNSSPGRTDFVVPTGAAITRPYWHRNDPERDNIFEIDQPKFATLPIPPPHLQASLNYKFQGEEGVVEAIPGAMVDGQRRELAVVPAFSVLLQRAAYVLPTTSHGAIEVKVEIEKIFSGAADTSVRLQVPPGWQVTPSSQPLGFSANERIKTVTFKASHASLREGNYQFSAALEFNGKIYREGFSVVSREDLDTFYYYQPATQRVSVVDVKVPKDFNVGYVMGAGDDIPTVLEHLGIHVIQLSAAQVEHADLSRFGAIVLGIRAYDTRDDVRKNNKRLLDYVAAGGTLIVQNNFSVQDFNHGDYTPFPAQLSSERVSVEEAPVQILAASDGIFHYPNEISARDFDGWVQERGVNFMSSWDDHFLPLLASSDPGESPLKGGMLRARFAKGTYIYTGYAFFRQLPSGVPGAVRLYMNLLSAGHEPKSN